MLDYLFHLLPEWLQAKIRPELDHLIADFAKLDAEFTKLLKRHASNLGELHEAKRTIETSIAGLEHEIARTERVAKKISNLVS